ncbi:hypothetical protein THRCLA_01905 [Thraustotheca clavata]|uniref:Uncharacterized protein n=1 Tax=Thraustotheca clavata TaxID=74557 RepID=A0A1W0A6Z6_9STRA|nr:hypothetical protein THRCLA_01905 [Thraustotheca clavata]
MTEIIAGCSDAEIEKINQEPVVYHEYYRYFTPSFSPHPEPNITDIYAPYNKPFGLRHYFTHAESPIGIRENMPFALFDSDFVLFEPLQVNTGRDISQNYVGAQEVHIIKDTVIDGIAIAHDWKNYMGAGWFRDNMKETKDKICQTGDCANISEAEGLEFYSRAGPPYIMTKNDGMKMINDYCDFAIMGRKLFPKEWMVEMYAYSLAAGNHNIKHIIVNNLGINWPGGEPPQAWNFIDSSLPNPCYNGDIVLPPTPPAALHYCQRLGLELVHEQGYYFYKYNIPTDMFDCNAMLLEIPPSTQWDEVFTKYTDNDTIRKKRHEVWGACTLAKIANEAFLQVKKQTCPKGFNTFTGIPMNETQRRESAWPRKPKL